MKIYKEYEIPDQQNCVTCSFFRGLVDFQLLACDFFKKKMDSPKVKIDNYGGRGKSSLLVYTYVEPLEECKKVRDDNRANALSISNSKTQKL